MNPGYILVVDDEPDIRRLVQEILEDEHYKVVTAENAKAAREAVRKQRPDLVLLDIWMPDTDGISLLREWSQSGNLEMPVIMISGHGTVETAVAARYLHAHSGRKDAPFVEVSLAAISPQHVAAQLFGQEQKGAIKPGSFDQAAGGTLLLN